MKDVSAGTVMPMIIVAGDKNTDKKQPVLIEFTPGYKREHGISNEIDLLRSPQTDEYGRCGQPGQVAMALKMPTPQQTKEFILFLPVLLEAGDQALKKLFDIIDTWNDRNSKSGKDDVQHTQAMVLPEGLVESLSVNGINPEA